MVYCCLRFRVKDVRVWAHDDLGTAFAGSRLPIQACVGICFAQLFSAYLRDPRKGAGEQIAHKRAW